MQYHDIIILQRQLPGTACVLKICFLDSEGFRLIIEVCINSFEIFLPEPVASDLFECRQIAIERAVSEFCSQFMPVYKWKWEREAPDE